MGLQEQCAMGQELLEATEYIAAEQVLVDAEATAWELRDFDTLARLYMPLQEARRQRRQKCGEGKVWLGAFASNAHSEPDVNDVLDQVEHGQLLVAGWGSLDPAVRIRGIAEDEDLYVETFLAATFPIDPDPTGEGIRIVIVPTIEYRLPAPTPRALSMLLEVLPKHCIVLRPSELETEIRSGTDATYADVMAMWERLHAPFLQDASAQVKPIPRIEAYRKAIRVDYACEIAHQKIADEAAGIG